MEPIIQTYQLQKTFGGEQALKPLDFHLQKGEICALIGKNGAGKSTFFKILSGQIVATAGEVHVFGQSGDAVASQKSRLGFMVESPQFFPDFTAAQNMKYFRIQRGVVEKARVTEVLKLVGLSHHRKKKFHEYSMGMKQRLGIALCLLSGPDCLVLDEPINGLDAEGIKEVRQLLLELNQQKQMTILVSSHLLAELQLIASRFVFIKDGTVVEDVSKAELEDKSKKQLILHVDLPAKAVQLIERQYEGVDYLLLPDKGLKLFNYLDSASEINRLLVENGIVVREIQYESLNVEDYFLGLVEDDVHA